MEEKKRKLSKILSTIVTILFVAVMLLAVLGYKGVGGYRYLDILTGSMEPNIPVGAVVVIKETPISELKVHDVITYRLNSSTYVTHRIVKFTEDKKAITKGDANNADDIAPVSESQIVGKVLFKVNYIGKIFLFIQKHVFVVVGVFAFLLFLPDIIRKLRK